VAFAPQFLLQELNLRQYIYVLVPDIFPKALAGNAQAKGEWRSTFSDIPRLAYSAKAPKP